VRKLAVGFVILVAASGSAGAATYYVDAVNGCDDPAWNGGPGDPWATLTYALARASGENTFICRGTFEEEVEVGRDDDRSTFVGDPEAAIGGSIETVYEVVFLELDDFEIFGYAGGGSKAYVEVNNCYFNYPSGEAFQIARFHGGGIANDCVFEDCGSVMSIPGFEFGFARYIGCEVKDCEAGIGYSGEASVSATDCVFNNVAGVAFGASIWGEFGTVSSCNIINCGTGVSMAGTWYGGFGTIKDSTFKYNTVPITATHNVEDYGGITITGNVVTENGGSGVAVGGVRIKLRGNAITDNAGHGVYIAEGNPDLGTPAEPGGNTFAGNKSGYDVYNASPENIPACGNSWGPRSEQEMQGKTWHDVNVTRIYDHWDDPSVGYVMWCEPLEGVAPASLGRIKASFREGPASPARLPEIKATGD
jgi:hypothetical protein